MWDWSSFTGQPKAVELEKGQTLEQYRDQKRYEQQKIEAAQRRVEEYTRKYGGPHAGGVEVTDQSGNTTIVPYNQEINRALSASGTGSATMYQTPEGLKATSPIGATLNKETGEITITAPNSVLEREHFKPYKETLSTLSQYYRTDPNAQLADPTDESGKKTISVEEYVNRIDEDMKNLPALYEATDATNAAAKKAGISENLTEEEVIYMNTPTFDPEDEKLSNEYKKNRLLVPDLEEFNIYKNLETYNKNLGGIGSVTVEDAGANAHSREKAEHGEDADARIVQQREVLEQKIRNNDYTDKHDYMATQAMYNYITGVQPETAWYRAVMDAGTNLVLGIGAGVATTAAGIASGAEGIANWVTGGEDDLGARDIGTGLNGESYDEAHQWQKTYDDLLVLVQDHASKASSLNAGGADVFIAGDVVGQFASMMAVGGVVGSSLTTLAGSAALSAGNAISAAGAALGTVAAGSGATTTVGSLLASGEAAMLAGLSATELAGIGALANYGAGAMAFIGAHSALVSATLAGVTGIGQILSGMGSVAAGLTTTTGGLYAIKGVSATVDIMSGALLDAATTDPQLFRNILENDTDEGSQYMFEQFAWNLGGWAGFGVGGKAVTAGLSTKPGQILTATAGSKLMRVESAMGNLKERFKTVVFGDETERIAKLQSSDKPRKQTKGNVAAERLRIRDQKQLLGDMHILGTNMDHTMENVRRYQAEAVKLKAAYNAIDDLRHGIASVVNEQALDSDQIKAAREMRLDTSRDIVKLEKKLGLYAENGARYLRDGTKIFSDYTSNYIGAKLQRESLLRQMNPAAYGIKQLPLEGKALKNAQKVLDDLDAKIVSFTQKASPELVSAADNYITAYRSEVQGLMQWGVHNGVVDAEEYGKYLATEFWGKEGELYGVTQRKAQFQEYVRRRADGKLDARSTFDFKHKAPVAEGDFVDPNLAITDLSMTLANSLLMDRNTKALLATAGATRHVSVDGTKLADVNKVNKLSSVYDNKVKENLPKIKDNIAQSDIASDIVIRHPKNAKERGAFNNLNALIDERSKKIAELGEKKPKTVRGKAKQTAAISGFSSESTAEILQANSLSPIGNQIVDRSSYQRLILSDDSPLPQESRSIIRQEVEKYAKDTGKKVENYTTYREVIKSDDGLLQRADTAQITSNPDIMQSDLVKNEIKRYYQDQEIAQVKQSYDVKIDKMAQELGYPDGLTLQAVVNNVAGGIVDDLVDSIADSTLSEELVQRLNRLKGGDFGATDIEQEFLALQSLIKNEKEIKSIVESSLDKNLIESLKGTATTLDITDANNYKKMIADQVKTEIETRYNALRNQLSDSKSPIVDYDDWVKDIKEAKKAIGDTIESTPNLVRTRNAKGQIEYVETDITTANLLNYRIPAKELGTIGKLNYAWNKVFRFGTTGFRLASYVTQGFRDTMNAFVGGNMYRTMGGAMDEMAEFMGEEFVEDFKRLNPDAYKRIAQEAGEAGSDIKRGIAQYELNRGKIGAGEITETMSYARSNTNQSQWTYMDNGYTDSRGNRLEQTFDNATKKMMAPHDFREKTLRNHTYANAYSDAVKRGETIEQARISATFAQRTATTNFGIATYHLNSLRDSVPYIGAAINGTKSFYRLLSLDPVGVMGRMFMGVGVPMMALTAMSLGTEENRKIWRNIPEYQKDGNIIFVCNGQVVAIPIPEEMSGLLSPFRHFIEELYDANRHEFTSLAVSDILGLSPVSIDGFYNLDQSAIMGNPTLWERMGAGTSRLFAQTAPPLVKSAFMWATGIDPLSGVAIDTTYTTYDEDTGQSIILDSKSGSFARWLHSIFGDNLSAPVAQKIIENFVGKGLTPALDFLSDCCAWVNDSSSVNPFMNLGESLVTDLASPLNVEKRNTADLQWRIGVSQLWDIKDELLNDNAYQQVTQKINNATTLEEKQKHINARNSMLQERFYSQVQNVVTQFVNVYAGEFTPYKFGSLISLMTIEDMAPSTSAVGQLASEDIKRQGKAAALETMYKMGFGKYQNQDVLGQVRTASDGTFYVEWNTPLGVLSAERNIGAEDEAIRAGIQLKMREGTNLEQAYYDINDQIQAIYDKDKLSSADYNQIDAIKANWNAQVMERIGPYIQRYGMAKVLRDRETIDYLQKFIQVPSAYEIDNRGRRISASRLNKQQGFSPNYIRAIFNEYDKRTKGQR